MPNAHTLADSGLATDKPADRPASRAGFARRFLWVVLVVMVNAEMQPSSRLMAFEGQSDGEKPSAGLALRPAAAPRPDIPYAEYDPIAEHVLFDLANQARTHAGLPALKPDPGLSEAARSHAQAMVAAQQLSHQFDGEPSLPQRLAAATRLLLETEGENVAFDVDVENGHKHLMLSPAHRANLLNASYNVIGLGVIRSGNLLYIVQDFGQALPTYSLAEVKDRIAGALTQTRQRSKQPRLARRDSAVADDAACSMAQADKLGTATIQEMAQRYTVLTYTSLQPDVLPAKARPVLSNRNLHAFSVGACYARTDSYPTGAYWILLALQ